MVGPRTSAQRAAFDIVSIVPSTSMPWMTPPTTITTARGIGAMRHVRGRSPNRRRSAANRATGAFATVPGAYPGRLFTVPYVLSIRYLAALHDTAVKYLMFFLKNN